MTLLVFSLLRLPIAALYNARFSTVNEEISRSKVPSRDFTVTLHVFPLALWALHVPIFAKASG